MKPMVIVTLGVLLLTFSPVLPVRVFPHIAVVPALAEESWKQEFDAVCGKSDDSMNLSKDELKALMARCDKLKPLIEAQDETVRKVYLRRLQMCRDLLAYVYEVKSKD